MADKNKAVGSGYEIRIKDERVSVPVLVGDSDEVVFTLYFNPADEDIELYLYELENLKPPGEAGTKEMRIEYLRKKRECIDNIFGSGASTMIGRYTGLELDLVNKLADSVKLGIDEFKKAAKAKEAEARKDIQANAKAEAATFINSK